MSVKVLAINTSEPELFVIRNAFCHYCDLIVCDGLEAIRLINKNADIDLVILDLSISQGLRILNKLRKNEKYKELRIIIITDNKEIEKKGIESGATDYISKPINVDSLKTKLKAHLELIKIHHALNKKRDEQCLAFDTIFQQAPIGIAIYNGYEKNSENGGLTEINLMFEKITGRTYEEIVKLGWAMITHPDDLEEDIRNYRRFQAGELNSYSMEKRYIKPDGSIVWVHMVVASLTLSGSNKNDHICLIQDITKRKEIERALAESERSKSVLLSHLPGMAYRCKYDREWTMLFVSAGCFELTGYTSENLLYNRDISYNSLIAPEYRDLLWERWKQILEKRQPFKYEYEIITAKGERKWVLEMGQGIYNEQGAIEALEGIILDISDRKEIENNLRYNNEHDIWTGLHNRRYLENLLENDVNIRSKKAIVGINLSAVHLTSLTYGFHYSQDLIKKIADYLKIHCDNDHQLFSTYENQFAFYVKAYRDKNELVKFCEALAETLESILSIERINGGIGVLEIDCANRNNAEQLLKNLSIASEKAINTYEKDIGICFFDKHMDAQLVREEDIKRELAQIAEGNSNGLFLLFQPILDLKSNKICGFEALARLHSEKLGLVPPLEFIPISEKTKLIIPLGEKIIHKAFSFLNKLKENGYKTISVSINISAIQLARNDFIKNLLERINVMNVDPANIGLEITESMFASNYQEMNNILGELMNYGIKIAIDDFGTGYSSLARERELNVNCLKIDKYFIDKLLTLKSDEAITGDIISMAHRLGHSVIAEGIEHEKQVEYLKNHDCDKIQGYLVSRPIDEENAIELLKTNYKQPSSEDQ